MSAAAALLAERVEAAILGARGGAPIIGLCGVQGSGKSTVATAAAQSLAAQGVRCVVVSLDDAYLTLTQRRDLAARVHPLLATRGPPGTHDLNVLNSVLDRLKAGSDAVMPVFDKLVDDRAPRERRLGPADAVILEGWCVGAEPQPVADLAAPVNALEAEEDPRAVWRSFVNDRLAQGYRRLFDRLDGLMLLRAPSFGVVSGWRGEQEARNAASSGRTPMSARALDRFIQHYERITQRMLAAPPAAVDLIVDLDAHRQVAGVHRPRAAPRDTATS